MLHEPLLPFLQPNIVFHLVKVNVGLIFFVAQLDQHFRLKVRVHLHHHLPHRRRR